MADAKLSELTALGGASIAGGDEVYLNDVSAATSKKTTMTDMALAVHNTVGVQTIPPVVGQAVKFSEYFSTLILHNYSGSANARLGPGDFSLPSTCPVGWGSGFTTAGAGSDTFIYRDAANIVAQRNLANAQTYRLYTTWTDASNNELLELGSTASVPYIWAKKNGTGTQRALNLGAGANHLNIGTDGVTTVAATTATPAAGSTAARLLFGTTAGFGIYYGSGAPTVSAGQGSLYLNSTGSSSSTRLYVNSTGSTTWVAVTTAS